MLRIKLRSVVSERRRGRGRGRGAYVEITGAWKVLAVFVKRDGHNTISGIKGLFDAVAVVDINIDVEDAVVESRGWGCSATDGDGEQRRRHAPKQLDDTKDNVVDIAEARRLVPLCVVEASAPVDGDV